MSANGTNWYAEQRERLADIIERGDRAMLEILAGRTVLEWFTEARKKAREK